MSGRGSQSPRVFGDPREGQEVEIRRKSVLFSMANDKKQDSVGFWEKSSNTGKNQEASLLSEQLNIFNKEDAADRDPGLELKLGGDDQVNFHEETQGKAYRVSTIDENFSFPSPIKLAQEAKSIPRER